MKRIFQIKTGINVLVYASLVGIYRYYNRKPIHYTAIYRRTYNRKLYQHFCLLFNLLPG